MSAFVSQDTHWSRGAVIKTTHLDSACHLYECTSYWDPADFPIYMRCYYLDIRARLHEFRARLTGHQYLIQNTDIH